jgi:pimeloyl-ACP methyl ester carboxylesterase
VYTEHLRIPVGAGALHVERVGRGGPAVILLHGFGTCAFLWRAVAPRLAHAGCTVVAIDLLGHGESDRPPDVAFRLGAQADYVERALTALRLADATVVGEGMGAIVALLLAARHPRRVRRLALLEPPDPTDLPGPAIRAVQRTTALTALSSATLFGARPLLETLLAESLLRSAADSPPDERVVARYLAPYVGINGAAELLQLASAVMLTPDELQALGNVQGDVLLWVGGDSRSVAPREAQWRRWLPEARITLQRAPHRVGALAPEVAPTALATALQTWIT